MNKYDDAVQKIATLFLANSSAKDERTYDMLCQYVDELFKEQMKEIEERKAAEKAGKQIKYFSDFTEEAVEAARNAELRTTDDDYYVLVGLDGNEYSDIDELINANNNKLYEDYLGTADDEVDEPDELDESNVILVVVRPR